MKSFPDRPSMAWVQMSKRTLLYMDVDVVVMPFLKFLRWL